MYRKQNTMRGMRSNSAVNQPTGGGTAKKSGLAASNLGGAGVGLLHGRTYMGGPRGVQANYRNKDLVFHYKSYIGGIGHSVGGRSLGRMMDGVRSKSIPSLTPDPLSSPLHMCSGSEVPFCTLAPENDCGHHYQMNADGTASRCRPHPYFGMGCITSLECQPTPPAVTEPEI